MKFDADEVKKFYGTATILGANDCWQWQGTKGAKGYGHVYIGGMLGKAHRVSYMMANDTVIPPGMHVMHSCDFPGCINPAHLSLGTNAENVADKMRKGRHTTRRGMTSTSSKLTDDIVKRILWDRISGASISELAATYDLNNKTVTMICDGRSWPHIPGSDGAPTMTELMAVPVLDKKGVAILQALLTEVQVIDIMVRLARGEPAKPIARELGIHFVTINNIKHGKTWLHLQGNAGVPTVMDMRNAKPLSKFTAKVDATLARQIKLRLAAGEAPKTIAASLGISPGAVYHIKTGRTWSEIDIGVDLMALPLMPRGSRRP